MSIELEDFDLPEPPVALFDGDALLGQADIDALFGDMDKIMRAGVDIARSRPPELIGAIMREHAMIVEAIRAQDADGAALAMRSHLSEGRKRLLP